MFWQKEKKWKYLSILQHDPISIKVKLILLLKTLQRDWNDETNLVSSIFFRHLLQILFVHNNIENLTFISLVVFLNTRSAKRNRNSITPILPNFSEIYLYETVKFCSSASSTRSLSSVSVISGGGGTTLAAQILRKTFPPSIFRWRVLTQKKAFGVTEHH